MKNITSNKFRRIFLSVTLLMAFLAGASCSPAQQEMRIEDAWIAEAPPASKVLAAYMKILNPGDKAIEISKVASTDFSSIEIHRSVDEDGMASMQRQTGIHIDANSSFELKPGDFHLMMFNPIKRFNAGDSSRLIFTFVDGSTVAFDVPVKKAVDYASNGHH